MMEDDGAIHLSKKENQYFAKEYLKIDYQKPSMSAFLKEIYGMLKQYVPINTGTSLLDIGCGRGYLLRYLKEEGLINLRGIDPCSELLKNKLFIDVGMGGFENNDLRDDEFDIVFTCHTLHHLKERYPFRAIQEMIRISKKYIVIVEINNTNFPMFFISLLNYKVERNAFSYNRSKVINMVITSGCKIVHAGDMKTCYVSGNGLFYKLLSRIGNRPYNIIIAEKV